MANRASPRLTAQRANFACAAPWPRPMLQLMLSATCSPTPLQPVKRRMSRWTLALAGVAAAVALAGGALAWRLPSNGDMAKRAATILSQAAGTPVTVGGLAWQLWPQPALTLTDVASSPTGVAAQALHVERVTAYPLWSAVLFRSGAMHLKRLEVDGATLPQLALTALNKTAVAAKGLALASAALQIDNLAWRKVSWVSRYGAPLVVAGEAAFDADWRPRSAVLRVPDAKSAKAPTQASLTRQGHSDRWAVSAHIGSGSAKGELTLQALDSSAAGWALNGTLALQGIELAQALAALNRRTIVAGRVSGTMTVSARSSAGNGALGLVSGLQTQTRFSLGPGALLRFDLSKAVRTLGADVRGQTALDSITGHVASQNSASGMVLRFTDLKVRSGALTAVGEATLAGRTVDATLAVDVVDGLVGVPLRITGPTYAVNVSVPPSALAGAAVGTAVLPGVGTVLGARLGSAIARSLSGLAGPPAAAGHTATGRSK